MLDWNFIAGLIATVAFDIIYFGAIIGTITVIILDNRNPVKTMAWILVLMFLPVVGLVFYFFFGRSQRRVRVIGKKSYNRLLKKPMAEYLAQDSCALPANYGRLISLFRNTNQAFPFDGNRVEVYTRGHHHKSHALPLPASLSPSAHRAPYGLWRHPRRYKTPCGCAWSPFAIRAARIESWKVPECV